MSSPIAPASIEPDVVIIGGGPGGYIAAIRAAQLGLSTVCVEMDKTLGGTCVNVGCIPSKALLTSSEHYDFLGHAAATHGIGVGQLRSTSRRCSSARTTSSAQNTKGIEFLFRKNKITWAKGRGTLRAGQRGGGCGGWGRSRGAPPAANITTFRPKNVIIATGSVPIELPFLKFDEERVLSNVGALKIPNVPKHLIVIGGGVIGLELGSVWKRLGAKVTVIELLPTILPGMDDEVIRKPTRRCASRGSTFAPARASRTAGAPATACSSTSSASGKSERIEGDYVLVVGRSSPVAHRHRRGGARPQRRQARRNARRRPDAHQPPQRVSRSAIACPGRCSRTRPKKKASSPPR